MGRKRGHYLEYNCQSGEITVAESLKLLILPLAAYRFKRQGRTSSGVGPKAGHAAELLYFCLFASLVDF